MGSLLQVASWPNGADLPPGLLIEKLRAVRRRRWSVADGAMYEKWTVDPGIDATALNARTSAREARERMLSQGELGERLRRVREVSGLTQARVAAELGVSRQGVVALEAGRRAVSALELDRLALLFGRSLEDFLRPGFAVEEDPLAALLRAAPELAPGPGGPVAEERARGALRRAVRVGRELSGLEQALGLVRGGGAAAGSEVVPEVEKADLPGSRWDAVLQGEREAVALRRRLDLGGGPIGEVARLAVACSAHGAAVELSGAISGLTLWQSGAAPLVVVNAVLPALRQRLAWAHELGHLAFDHGCGVLVSRARDREELREVRANAFAAALLMPESGVRELVGSWGKGQPTRPRAQVFDGEGAVSVEGRLGGGSQRIQLHDAIALARHFGVPVEAALYRLRNLRLLEEPEFAALLEREREGAARRLGSVLWPEAAVASEVAEPAGTYGVDSRLFGLALEAYRRELISQGRVIELAALVGLAREEALALLDDAGLLEAAPAPMVELEV